MALERDLRVVSYPAAGDLSTKQFHIAAINSDGRAACANGSVDKFIGVLQNKPNGTSVGAGVGISGVTKCVAGGSIAAGDAVTADAAGFAIATTTGGNSIVGRAVSGEATGSGLIFELQIMPSTL